MENKRLNRYLYFLLIFSALLCYPVHIASAAAKKGAGGGILEVTYTSQFLRDPFKSPFELEAELYRGKVEPEPERAPLSQPTIPMPIKTVLPGLDVQGIVWNAEVPQAIINDRVVTIGDVIQEAEVLDIRKEGVYVLYQGGQYILRPTISKRNGR